MEEEATAQRRAQQPACKNGSTKQLPSSAGAKPLRHNPLLVINFILMAVGSACGPLLLRAYFLHGGTRKWLSSLLTTAGWPLLLAPLSVSILSRRRHNRDGDTVTRLFLMSPRLLVATVAVGLMTGLDDFLYAYGLAYLPVSTSSTLVSTQLAFTAAFALLLVRQRFTAFSVNAVVLISVGAAMLGMNAGGDRPAGVTRVQYYAGFGMTLGAAALYGLVLPDVEHSQARHAARAGAAVTYTLVMEMQIVIGFTATAFSAVTYTLVMNNDFQAIPREAREFGLGQTVYYLLLAGSVISYQFFLLGIIGTIFYGSALLAGVITTVLIPVTEVLAILFFHEPFDVTKGVALALSLWGFVSYLYGEVRTKAQRSDKPLNTEHLDP